MRRSVPCGSHAAVPVATLCSAVLHGLVVCVGTGVVGAGWLSWSESARPPLVVLPGPATSASSIATIDIEVRAVSEADVPGMERSSPKTPVPSVPAGRLTAAPDGTRAGRGGSGEASSPAVNLADRDDGIRLSRRLANHMDRDQVPRVLSALERRSWEDMRLTTRPMELTFLAMGQGERQERRAPADRDPSSGLARARAAAARGAEQLGRAPLSKGEGALPRPSGAAILGSKKNESPGIGVEGTSPGNVHRSAARVATARPSVDQGLPSVPAAESGPPADTVDSSQLVASSRQSLTDASTAGGKLGEGRGGARGPGATGGGGVDGPGFRSSPLGYGPGGYGRSNNDPRIDVYSQRLRAKLYPYWTDAFPRWAIADLRQGRVIITIEILRDGSVRHAYVTRASGINEFDRNCLRAVHAASPFDPIPKALGLARMRIEVGFDATNPLVR